MIELELHQLELRYAGLRKCHPAQERALLASLAEIGQQLPIVVIGEAVAPLQAARYVVIDGYKRVARHGARHVLGDPGSGGAAAGTAPTLCERGCARAGVVIGRVAGALRTVPG